MPPAAPGLALEPACRHRSCGRAVLNEDVFSYRQERITFEAELIERGVQRGEGWPLIRFTCSFTDSVRLQTRFVYRRAAWSLRTRTLRSTSSCAQPLFILAHPAPIRAIHPCLVNALIWQAPSFWQPKPPRMPSSRVPIWRRSSGSQIASCPRRRRHSRSTSSCGSSRSTWASYGRERTSTWKYAAR